MLKISIELEVPNEEEGQTTLEYIASEIGKGYKAGEGWEIEGENEESDEDWIRTLTIADWNLIEGAYTFL